MGLPSIFKVRTTVPAVSRNTSILSFALWFILCETEFKTEVWGISKSNCNGAIYHAILYILYPKVPL